MTESRIRLLPGDKSEPRGSRIPLTRARRWFSPFPEDACKPVVNVFVTPRAYVRFCSHAGTDLQNEIGGALVGKWRADRETGEQFIVVEAILRAKYTQQSNVHLTFTQDTLVTMQDELESHYPNKQLVGWYHTHPRMGVFLSRYDTWLHENFFPEAWQVALVIEPHSVTGGFFIRQTDGALDPHRYFGFYELLGQDDASVVHWRNMQPEAGVEWWGGIENE
jgi:proteasome lid subunit RPN8/RPN11